YSAVTVTQNRSIRIPCAIPRFLIGSGTWRAPVDTPQQLEMEKKMAQKVLITAGAGGIGWAIAQAFLDAGHLVHIFDIDQEAVDNVIGSHPNLSGSTGN